MPRRSRRGFVPQPTAKQISKYYKIAKPLMTIAAKAATRYGKSKYIPGGDRLPVIKRKAIKEDQSLTSSSGKSFSKQSSGKKLIRHKDVPSMINYTNGKGILNITSGAQEYVVPDYVMNGSDLEQWYANSSEASLGSANDKRLQLYVENVSGHIMLKNHCNAQAVVTLYECIMKKSSTASPLSLIKDGTSTRFNLDPTVSNTRYSLINMSPTFSKYFTSHVKVISGKKIILDPGQVHEHTYSYQYNKNFAVADYFQELNNGTVPYIAGWTRFLLIRAFGTPVVDSSTGLTAGTSSGKIIYTTDMKVNYKILFSLKEKSATVAPGIVPLGGEKTIVEDTDAVTTITYA